MEFIAPIQGNFSEEPLFGLQSNPWKSTEERRAVV